MSDNKLLDLSLEFAAVIVDLVDHINIPKSAYMTDQLGRAGTSIGANIHEANTHRAARTLSPSWKLRSRNPTKQATG